MKRKVGLETQKYKKKFDLLKSRKVLKVEMNSPQITMTSIFILHISVFPQQNSTLFVTDNSLSHLNRSYITLKAGQLPFSSHMTFLTFLVFY